MGQKRTLLNKLTNSTRKPSTRKGTKNRRVIYGTAIETDEVALIYSYHTTKGRIRYRLVEAAKAQTVEQPSAPMVEEAWPEPISRDPAATLRPMGDMPMPDSRGFSQ